MRRSSALPDADAPALDEETVERLLAGDLPPDQVPAGYAEVAALLAATVAPPSPEELAGREAALAELRRVTRTRRAGAAAGRAGRSNRRRRVGLAVVVVVGALATGGAAAAATGHLPGPVRDAARGILGTIGGAEPATPTRPGSQPAPSTEAAGSGGATSATQGPRPAGAAGHGPGSSVAGPYISGLCQAFVAGNGAEQGKKLDAAAFQALARAAGGPDKIRAYCQDVQAGDAKAKEHRQQDPPEDEGQGQGDPPPGGGGNGGSQGQGGPPSTRSTR